MVHENEWMLTCCWNGKTKKNCWSVWLQQIIHTCAHIASQMLVRKTRIALNGKKNKIAFKSARIFYFLLLILVNSAEKRSRLPFAILLCAADARTTIVRTNWIDFLFSFLKKELLEHKTCTSHIHSQRNKHKAVILLGFAFFGRPFCK